jgi:hypothetical protein
MGSKIFQASSKSSTAERASLNSPTYEHPSLQFKKLTERGGLELWSARVTLNIALAVKLDDDYVWFWIGEHDAYERRDLSRASGKGRFCEARRGQ